MNTILPDEFDDDEPTPARKGRISDRGLSHIEAIREQIAAIKDIQVSGLNLFFLKPITSPAEYRQAKETLKTLQKEDENDAEDDEDIELLMEHIENTIDEWESSTGFDEEDEGEDDDDAEE